MIHFSTLSIPISSFIQSFCPSYLMYPIPVRGVVWHPMMKQHCNHPTIISFILAFFPLIYHLLYSPFIQSFCLSYLVYPIPVRGVASHDEATYMCRNPPTINSYFHSFHSFIIFSTVLLYNHSVHPTWCILFLCVVWHPMMKQHTCVETLQQSTHTFILSTHSSSSL